MSRWIPSGRFVRRIVVASVLLVVGIAAWLNWPWLSARWESHSQAGQSQAATSDADVRVTLFPERPGTVRIPEKLLATSRFKLAPVIGSPAPEPLLLRGSIILDPNRNSRVHSLFSGIVVKVGVRGDMSTSSERLSNSPDRGLQPGDDVKQGQILAVIHSKDAGTMKTDLVNQLTKYHNDKTILDRYLKVEEKSPGVIPPTQLTQQTQLVEGDAVAIANAERTLRSAQFTESEIAVIKREAEKTRDLNAPRDLELERTWAEYLVRAPFDGRIVEKNATVGDAIDVTTDLYKIAKLDRLRVLVDVYEEDLPKLQQIAEDAAKAETKATPSGGSDSPGIDAMIQGTGDELRAWTISYQATGEGEPGAFDKIGTIIDPMQHTGTVGGWVNNTRRRLFIGQFVTATIPLRPDPTLVAVPTGAIVESPDGPILFVRTDAKENLFTIRKVAVVVRGREQIFLLLEPNAMESKRGAEPINPGDVVLSRGAVEISGELETLQSEAKK